jgi:hypothetical protein
MKCTKTYAHYRVHTLLSDSVCLEILILSREREIKTAKIAFETPEKRLRNA